MKIRYTEGKISVELEGDTQKALFKQLAEFQEVFANTQCKKCLSESTRFVVRENNGNEYHELRCTKCQARLSFGANRQGGSLFPKRKDENEWLPDSGWVKYNKDTGKNE
tara:strand:- start:11161 stop:11487 length:327 start_codon:yes stop_codon:yes gene_type:complete